MTKNDSGRASSSAKTDPTQRGPAAMWRGKKNARVKSSTNAIKKGGDATHLALGPVTCVKEASENSTKLLNWKTHSRACHSCHRLYHRLILFHRRTHIRGAVTSGFVDVWSTLTGHWSSRSSYRPIWHWYLPPYCAFKKSDVDEMQLIVKTLSGKHLQSTLNQATQLKIRKRKFRTGKASLLINKGWSSQESRWRTALGPRLFYHKESKRGQKSFRCFFGAGWLR